MQSKGHYSPDLPLGHSLTVPSINAEHEKNREVILGVWWKPLSILRRAAFFGGLQNIWRVILRTPRMTSLFFLLQVCVISSNRIHLRVDFLEERFVAGTKFLQCIEVNKVEMRWILKILRLSRSRPYADIRFLSPSCVRNEILCTGESQGNGMVHCSFLSAQIHPPVVLRFVLKFNLELQKVGRK